MKSPAENPRFEDHGVLKSDQQFHSLAFPTRKAYFWLALAFVVFAVYGSLLPFNLSPLSLDSAWDRFRATIVNFPLRVSRSDVVANTLLFVPIGFFVAGTLLLDRPRKLTVPAALGAVVPVSLAVSMTTEFLQTFTLDRHPSSVDVAAQTAGSLVGVAIWAMYGGTLTRWLRDTHAASRDDRVFRLLGAYAAAWIFVGLAPFDITIDVGDLAARIRAGKIALVPAAGTEMTARWAWDALVETLSAIPLGVLGYVRRDRITRRVPSHAFLLGAAIVLLVELAQIFISSHAAQSTDVLFGWMGVGFGVSLAARLLPGSREAAVAPHLISGRALALLAVWSLVLCAYHWLPYDFEVDGEAIKRKLAAMSLLPFAGHHSRSDLKAFADVLTKLCLAVPFGVAAAFVLRNRRVDGAVEIRGWMLVAGIVFGAIELGQFFVPTRVPDTTDVLIGVGGTLSGLLLGRWLRGEPNRARK